MSSSSGAKVLVAVACALSAKGFVLENEPASCSSRPCTYTIRCASEVCTAAEVSDVQRSIDEAQPGDTIRLEGGRVFPVTSAPYGIQLKAKQGQGYITITTTEFERLPEEDTRITPDYAPLMPTIRADAPPYPAITTENGSATGPARGYKLIGLRLTNHPARDFSRGFIQIGTPSGYKDSFVAVPEQDILIATTTLRVDANAWVVLYTNGTLPKGLEPNTKYYVLSGSSTQRLRLSLTPGGRAVDIQDAGSGQHVFVEQGVVHPDLQATDIIIDRCIVTGTYDRQIRAGIVLHGRHNTVKNSYIERIQALGVDTQGIIGHNGTGPYLIENNYVDGVTENIMFGGARGLAPDNPPVDNRGVTSADITIRYNYLPKIPERYKWGAWAPGMYVEMGKLVYPPNRKERGYIAQTTGTTGPAEPFWPENNDETVGDGEVVWRPFSRNGSHWTVKNNFELKKGERVVFEYNVLDRMWRDGQEASMNIKSQNEPVACSPESDPTCYLGRTENVLIANNVIRSSPMGFKFSKQGITGIDWKLINNLFLDIDSAAYGGGKDWQGQVGGYPPTGLVMEHNTIIASNAAGAIAFDTTRGHESFPVVMRNNILSRGGLGMKGSGKGEGVPTFEYFLCNGEPCPDDQVGRNIIVGSDRRRYSYGTYNACMGDESCVPSYEAIGFRDAASGDYGLREDSPYRGQATDGGDIGVNMSLLPRISNIRIDAGARSATFLYDVSEPIRHIPCLLQVSSHRTLSEPVRDLNPALHTRADSDRAHNANNDGASSRMFMVGAAEGKDSDRALIPGTKYYYRLMCGGDARTGEFTTLGE